MLQDVDRTVIFGIVDLLVVYPFSVYMYCMIGNAVEEVFKKGDVVVKVGHQYQRLYQLLSGELEAVDESAESADGTPVVVNRISEVPLFVCCDNCDIDCCYIVCCIVVIGIDVWRGVVLVGWWRIDYASCCS